MSPQKIAIWIMSGIGGAIGLFAPVGIVKWLLQTEPDQYSWDDLERWADGMVAAVEAHGGRGGCPIGTLAAALSDSDESLRTILDGAFQTWHDAIRGALARLRENRQLAPDADLDRLSTITLSAIQGGLLLAKTSHDCAPLRIALDGAIAQLRAHAP